MDGSIASPIEPTLDVSRCERVLIAGFVTGGTDEIATDLETTRLLRGRA